MAWSNPPTRVSERGSAIQPRYVYSTDLSKGYLVYIGVIDATNRFFVKEYPGSTDTWYVDAQVGLVDRFDVWQSETTNQVVFAYSRLNKIYKMEVNFSTQAVISGPTYMFTGNSPALSREDTSKIDYIENDELQYREEFTTSATQRTLGDPPDRLFLNLQADMDQGGGRMRMSPLMMPADDIALPFSNITNTLIRYDGQTLLTSPRRLEDLTGNGYHLPIDNMPSITDMGLLYDGTYTPQVTWPVPGTALTIEAWIYPRFHGGTSYLIGGNDIRFGYRNNGALEFSFTGVATHTFRQMVRDFIVQSNQFMHIAVVHTWGSASTIMTINGSEVEADWVDGTGTEDPGYTNITSDVLLSTWDYLYSMRVLSVARTISQLNNYIAGKLL